MKKLVLALVLSLSLLFSGCAQKNDVTIVNGKGQSVTKTYVPYGLFDTGKENPYVEYSVSVGNVILSIVFIETIVVPVVLVGWYLYEPVGPKIENPEDIGSVK